MPILASLPVLSEAEFVHVVIEAPRGSRAKLAYDPKLGTFVLRKSLLTGLTYPHDWGFTPSTKADDGDPLDVMVILDAATFPGLVVICRIIGILQVEQKTKDKTERNDRLFAAPLHSHSERALKDVRDLTKPLQEEPEKFFIATEELKDKKLRIIGWDGLGSDGGQTRRETVREGQGQKVVAEAKSHEFLRAAAPPSAHRPGA
jgi:inorganic pyrophosphatase